MLYAEDFTNLKMPDGNVEPLISPKLAVAMESFSDFNSIPIQQSISVFFVFLLQAILVDPGSCCWLFSSLALDGAW